MAQECDASDPVGPSEDPPNPRGMIQDSLRAPKPIVSSSSPLVKTAIQLAPPLSEAWVRLATG